MANKAFVVVKSADSGQGSGGAARVTILASIAVGAGRIDPDARLRVDVSPATPGNVTGPNLKTAVHNAVVAYATAKWGITFGVGDTIMWGDFTTTVVL